mgnify:CR=1 FL=1
MTGNSRPTDDRVIMGIDPSINCTGICVHDTITGNNIYYMVVGKSTKKMQNFSNDFVHILDYHKQNTTNDDYPVKESKKTANISEICSIIKNIIPITSKLHKTLVYSSACIEINVKFQSPRFTVPHRRCNT